MMLQIDPALNIRLKKAGKPQSCVRSDAAALSLIDIAQTHWNLHGASFAGNLLDCLRH
jgi:hypothetical protein